MIEIDVGPFVLREPIGRGGMGEVWRGVHRRTDMPVAVKVLTPLACRSSGYYERFRAEVRAAAGLRHEGVVQLYDYGQIPAEATQQSSDRLTHMSPYLVMELLSGGSVSEARLSWGELRTLTLQVLDALAHAHARDVVHRDIKPANIMLSHRGGRAVLVDFGIAFRPIDDGDESSNPNIVAGTPAYMAPEQCTGESWRQGPWTDLYALGCTLWALTTGAAPFHANNVVEVLRCHVSADLPAYAPRVGVPAGFEDWLRQLLAKNPHRRYQRAADAAVGLLALAATESQFPASTPAADLSTLDLLTVLRETQQSSGTEVLADPSTDMERAEGIAVKSTMPDTQHALAHAMPPIPESWRPKRGAPRLGLTDAGLGLFRLREIPFIGRQRQRDEIWADLVAAADGFGPRAVAVGGATGAGKSRLVGWLAERAHELGAATVLRASFHARSDARHGLSGMLRRHYRTRSFSSKTIASELRDDPHVDPFDAAALSDFLAGAAASRASTPTERHALVARQLTRLAQERAVIVLLDDVHHSLDAIAFVDHLLASGLHDGTSLLVLMTLADEEVARSAAVREALAELPTDHLRHVSLDALSANEHQMLISELLRLEPNAAAVLQRQTAGNPLYTVELLGHWIERGVLQVSKAGYDLAGDAPTAMPDLAAVWRQHVARACAAGEEEEKHAIELAAVMGRHVDSAQWGNACEKAGLTPAWSLVDALVSAGLARHDADGLGWSFAHAMLRDSLVDQAREQHRAPALHAAIAAILALSESGGDKLQRAIHLERAGPSDEIQRLLFDAMDWGIERSELALAAQAQRMLRDRDARGELDAGAKCYFALRNARLAHQRDDADAQLRFATQAAQGAQELGDTRGECMAALECGRALLQLNRLEQSLQQLQRAETLARAERAASLQAESLRSQSETLAQLGRHQEALEAGLQAGDLHGRRGRPDHAGAAYVKAAMCAAILGRTDDAMDLLDKAQPLLEDARAARGLALLDNQRGEILRKRGDLQEAADAYRRALSRRRQLGLTSRGVEEANLALILQQSGQHTEARTSLERALPELRRKGQRLILSAVRSVLIASVAAMGDWAVVDELLALVTDDLRSYREVDVAESLERAGSFAIEQGERERAVPLLRLAAAQFDGLGMADRAAACRKRT